MSEEDKSSKPKYRIETALEEYSLAWFSGNPLDLDTFCKRFPDMEDELRKEIDAFHYVAGRLDQAVRTDDSTPMDEAPGVNDIEVSGEMLGDFRLIREIGRGGMGVVYEAEQVSLHRLVALKVLSPHLSLSRESAEKFQREAEAGGRQRHPGIVAVYAVGEHEGSHYLAQELVEEGNTLADRIEELRDEKILPPGYFFESVQLLVEAADALHHAHETSVIHRDVKPSNILLTREGRPKITDFGLAKLEDAMALSRTGDFAGTPYYMSPEQVSGPAREIDRRTDIYSLGVTLYEMLTLNKPFEGKSSYDVLRKIPNTDPMDPDKVNPRVPRDLSVICLKAMEKAPEKRYRTMKEFGEDLVRFLSGEVILAKSSGPGARLWKRIKRNPVVSAALAMILFIVLAFLGYVLLWSYPQIKMERDKAVKAQQAAEAERNRVSRHSDLNLVYRLRMEAEELWPTYPWKIEDLERWLDEARSLLSRQAQYRSKLELLRSTGRLTEEETELNDFLEKLTREIGSLGDEKTGLIMDVGNRLQFARTIHAKSIDDYRDEWERAIASIADAQDCPRYDGLIIEPIIGLVPIGQDPGSGLWEFAHLQTGEVPERDGKGRLVLHDETGLVFVLLPGGTFRMGAMEPDDDHPAGAPNVDPHCDHFSESPVRVVQLDPFLISKYEMTQGQWHRFTGSNPSNFNPDWKVTGLENELAYSWRNPLEMVNWHDCKKVLGRMNLLMPTDAQWEYAYRAGTTTVWYTGNDPEALEGHENIADASYKRYAINAEYAECVDWDDDHAYHAPVGSFKANPFGLHDMAGNVREWCEDRWANMIEGDLASGDGSRVGLNLRSDSDWRSFRGGNYRAPVVESRATFRPGSRPVWCDVKTGVRPAMRIR
jgi:formylglycine-generating enzyme required for sulfatase activity